MKWTRHRVLILAAVIFTAHVIAIFALHTPPPMVVLPDGFRSSRPLIQQSSTNATMDLDGLSDPLVFAGAHQHGFSAAAWMMRPRPEYAFTNSLPEPRFLAFARTPTELPRSDSTMILRSRTALPFVEFALPKETPQSTLTIAGGLEGRRLLTSLEPPIQFATDVLSNTVVQVGVRPDGFPFSTRIISGSGSRPADITALNIANKVRFAPLPLAESRNPAELQWGELVFQWFTTEPGATNAPPKTSVSAAK
jgi:hypothetical protein